MANQFIEMMTPMMIAILGIAVILYVVVVYILVKMNIEKSKTNISLLKIFGYTNSEVSKMYLNGNYIIALLDMIIGVPLGYKLVQVIYPTCIADITMRARTDTPISYLILVAIGVFLVFAFILQLLKGKVKKVDLAEVLKERD